ncbi:MAG: alpha-glucosidase C-terminal domain-containing protein [Bacteroidetes bacterium]|nr:alpha-glucosidase C-terminal domain-containing protein [Bacteroidota bacterium]
MQLKEDNPALWNGSYGGAYTRVATQHDKIYCYTRTAGDNKAMVILNLSSDAHDAVFSTDGGKYKKLLHRKKTKIKTGKKVNIPAWGYLVLVQ